MSSQVLRAPAVALCWLKLLSNGINVSHVMGPLSNRDAAAPLTPNLGAKNAIAPSMATATAIFTIERRRICPSAMRAQKAVTFRPSSAKLQAQMVRQVVEWAAKSAPIQRA